MTKKEFLNQLRQRLSGLSELEVEERLLFYSEMIDDCIEDGLTEEEAVAEMGPIDDIAEQAPAKVPDKKGFSELKHKTWVIVLLAAGAPVWLSLLVAAVSVVVSAYAAVWAVIISLWAVWGSLIAVAAGGLFSAVLLFIQGHVMQAAAIIGGCLFCAGGVIFAFFGINAASKGVVFLTKKICLWVRSLFAKREETV